MYEASTITVSSAVEKEAVGSPFGIDETRYSTFNKLLNVTAYVNRYLNIIKKKPTTKGVPTADELEEAKTKWIKYIQNKHYLETNAKPTKLNKQALQNQLQLRIGADGIVRCFGRFTNADLPQETITPILLPRGEKFVHLLIEDRHKNLCHAGVNHTLSQIRSKYWIPKGRAEVKLVLRRCKICQKYQGGPFKMPPMSPWPQFKTTISKPFQNTGLDYFGPLLVKNPIGEKKKVWVCLFTCVVVRAIHLEIVEDLSAEQFLMALRRFFSRRGKPDRIISDSARQFKLAKSTVDLAWKKVIKDPNVQSYVANQEVKWSFIVELSPWMGGFYERLVGSSKMALRKSIGRKCLTSLQLQTFLAETEAVLNSRPLVYVGDELNDGITITPSHFLSQITKTGTPTIENGEEIDDPNYEQYQPSSKEILLNTWKKGQRFLESFWKTWKNDYLLSLRERSKVKLDHPRIQAKRVPKPGDVIQIKEDLPRGSWKIGKIVEMIPSSDGNIRAAKVLLPTRNIINRPMNLLYPLECENEENQQDDSDAKNDQNKVQEINNDKIIDNETVLDEQLMTARRQSKRKSAERARRAIYEQSVTDEEF